MKDLIERLEAATGPSDELNDAIMAVLFQREERHIGCEEEQPDGTWAPVKDAVWVDPATGGWVGTHARAFTSSIDAALTLVPEHYSCELTQSATEPPRFARARLWDWRRSPLMSDPGNELKSEGNRPLALALCIAALKARCSVSSPQSGGAE